MSSQIVKCFLEIRKGSPKDSNAEGYWLFNKKSGCKHWTINGDLMVKYLMIVHSGQMVLSFCNFQTSYGNVEGSEFNPVMIEWNPQ